MSYIYDVLANFNFIYYDFYDWNESDDIVHIKRLPILKVDSEFFLSVKYNDVQVDKSLLDKIYRKTDFFKLNKSKFCYVCALCDGRQAFVVRFDSIGGVVARSSMLIDEENEVIDMCESFDINSFDFVVNNVNVYDRFKTRFEYKINCFILRELGDMSIDKLRFLYFDCFDEQENDNDKILKRIFYEINNNFDLIYSKIYDFLKLTSINK